MDTSIATLMTTVAGEILAFGDLKLIDLYFPPSFTKRFTGPKFGVAGIRRLLNLKNRPLLLAIMKPSQGYTAPSRHSFCKVRLSQRRSATFCNEEGSI